MLIEVLTGLLVLITGFYAFATFRILRANRNAVAVMEKQAEALSRPYIAVSVFSPSRYYVLYLRITNTGKTAAYDLRLEIDRDFYQYGDVKNRERNLAAMNAFTHPIQCFPPGAELVFGLAQGFVVFGEKADENITPKQFEISAKYSYAGKTVKESTVIDLRPYLGSMPRPDPLVEEVEKIRKTLEKEK